MSYNNILSTDELEKLSKDLNLKRNLKVGFTFDEIYDLIKNNDGINYYIFNLLGFSHLNNRLGHYIACVIDPKQKRVLIYTCYGIISYPVIEMFYSMKLYRDYEICFDLIQQQKINSNSCGWYCLRWLKQFDDKKTIVFENYIIFKYNEEKKSVEDYGFNVNDNWNIKRYKKYIREYLKIINA